jgi:hypothetical protein
MAVVVPLDRFSDVMARFNDRQIEEYKAAVVDALAKALPRLVESSPVDTGLYAQSWDLILTEKTAIIGNYAPHAPIIEYGARPFTPPLGPLVAWAKRVLRTQVGADELEKAAWALAKHTQQKISEEGMKPNFVLTNQLDLIIGDIERNMKESVSDWFK